MIIDISRIERVENNEIKMIAGVREYEIPAPRDWNRKPNAENAGHEGYLHKNHL